MQPDTLDRLVFCNGNPTLFERALQELGANWKPTNWGSRTVTKRRREDGLENMSIDMEQLVYKKMRGSVEEINE